ncbi:hypothetical protein ACFT0G_32550 [Streptomyces sp. NPDC057020]|uniref:hypothetical protein n=1 Tax=unclassified Streptomyces TaxID=2593676 RepID=UPI0036445B53
MSVEHACDGRILALSLPADLDVTGRAAAVQHAQRLLFSYRPLAVRLHLSAAASAPSGAALSVLARVRRLCEGLEIPLTLTTCPWPQPPRASDTGNVSPDAIRGEAS